MGSLLCGNDTVLGLAALLCQNSKVSISWGRGGGGGGKGVRRSEEGGGGVNCSTLRERQVLESGVGIRSTLREWLSLRGSNSTLPK